MKFGVYVFPDKPFDEIARLCQMAEKAGVEYCWVADEAPSPPFRDPFATFAVIGNGTRKLKLGSGINVPYVRHPALLAYAFKSFDELFPGRMILGLGPGGSLSMKPLGLKMWDRPLIALREAVQICRGLFEGETVTFEGELFKLYGTKLYEKPPSRIPIFLAARGPKMLELAGEIADGALTNIPPMIVPLIVEEISKGAKKSGRSLDSFNLTSTMPISIGKNEEEARNSARSKLVNTIAYANPETHRLTGVDLASVERLLKAVGGGWGASPSFVTDEMIDLYSFTGTLDKVCDQLKDYNRKGVDAFSFVLDSEHDIQTIREVISNFS
jgi:5,10-methylenetetrahydromethanopterin reductase